MIVYIALSTVNLRSENKEEEENHLIAPLLSLVIPGGGQFYTGSNIKGIIYAAIEISTAYGIYYQEDKRKKYVKLRDDLEIPELQQDKYNWYVNSIEFHRKNRDTFIWLTAVSFLLSAGDAYVDSYFKDFKTDIFYKNDSFQFIPSYNGFAVVYKW